MSVETKKNVDTNSAEFNEGVEAGLNSAENTKNWKAGNELGQELKDESKHQRPSEEIPITESSPPFILRTSPDGQRGNFQDEKDGTAE